MSDFPEDAPVYGPFFGVMGAASAMVFSGKPALNAPVQYFLKNPHLLSSAISVHRSCDVW